jgi:hypothetical protein
MVFVREVSVGERVEGMIGDGRTDLTGRKKPIYQLRGRN